MGESQFDAIGKSKEKLLEFFRTNFEDVVELVGEEKLAEQYFTNPRLPLISIKVFPPFIIPQSPLDTDIERYSAIRIITKTAA